MTQIDYIIRKEQTNADKIYLYLLEDRLLTFGCSAYYATLICPYLVVKRGVSTEEGEYLYICMPNDFPLLVSERYTTLVSDDCILIMLPEVICRQRDQFKNWQKHQLNIIL